MKTPLLTALFCCALSTAAEMTTVNFTDNGAELTNPGMGFVFHFYDNSLSNYGSRTAPDDMLDDWKGVSQVYLRLPWCVIEPEEGRFDWSVFDTPMERYRERGFKASFRVSCSETGFAYATPKWVEEAGAKGYRFTPGKGEKEDGTHWEPDFGDPVFLEKLDHLLAKLAERYDGHPDVELFDIGSMGVWGEGHTWCSTLRAYPPEVVVKHMDLYHKHFKKTQVLAQDDSLSRPGFKAPAWQPGDWTTFTFDMVFPRGWWGKKFTVTTGLVKYKPFQRADGWRTAPNPEQRVVIGHLTLDENGLTIFQPEKIEFPETFPDGCEFAAKPGVFDYDAANRPNSAKLSASYWRPQNMDNSFGPFLDIMDETGKKFVVGCAMEKEDDDLVDLMAKYRFGFRDDSILVDQPARAYFHAKAAQKLWRMNPVYIESEHYGGSMKKGCWQDGYGFLQSIEDYHATYASIHWWPHEFLEQNRELVRDINRIIGFRFLPKTVSFTKNCHFESRIKFSSTWQNRGVAPAYTDYYPALTFKNKQGGIVAVLVNDQFNLRDLPVALKQKAETRTSEVDMAMPPNMASGTYDVFLSVGDVFGKPVLELPIDGNDGKRRYKLGPVTVQGYYALDSKAILEDSGKVNLALAWTMHEAQEGVLCPFIHLDHAGRIAKVMNCTPSGNLAVPGTYTGTAVVGLPTDAKPGDVYTLHTGLWWPAKVARHDERLRPDNGSGDRRVLIATFVMGDDGKWKQR